MSGSGVRRVLVTRPPDRWPGLPERFAGGPLAVEMRATTAQLPPEDPVKADRALAALASYRFLLVASGAGAAALGARLAASGRAIPPGVRIVAIGAATARALGSAGLRADLVASDPRGSGLAREIAGRMGAGEKALLVGPAGGGAAAASLRDAGVAFDEAPLYRTVASPEAAALAREAIGGRFAGVAFTSPSSLDLWLEAAGEDREDLRAALGRLVRIAIGPTTGARLESCGLAPQAVAASPDERAVGDAIARAFESG